MEQTHHSLGQRLAARAQAWHVDTLARLDANPELRLAVLAADKVSVAGTYMMWVFFGLVGGHRIWMGRRLLPTLLYAVTGGYFLIGWAYDGLTIPRQVRRINARIDRAVARERERLGVPPT